MHRSELESCSLVLPDCAALAWWELRTELAGLGMSGTACCAELCSVSMSKRCAWTSTWLIEQLVGSTDLHPNLKSFVADGLF